MPSNTPDLQNRLKSERVQTPYHEALKDLPGWEITTERPVLRCTRELKDPEVAESLLRMAQDVGREHGCAPRVIIEDDQLRIELPTTEGGVAMRDLQLARALDLGLLHFAEESR